MKKEEGKKVSVETLLLFVELVYNYTGRSHL